MASIRIVIDRNAGNLGAARGRRRVRAAALVGLLVGGAAAAGITAATASTPTVVSADGPYRYLATPFKLFTNHSFAANASYSVLGIGGATTVPTNANSILIHVTAKATTGGSLTVTPAGLNADGWGQSMNIPIGVTVTHDFALSVGTKSQITFTNGPHAATASATILGYSVQSTASDISDEGARFGQVLTSSGGLGSTWAAPGGPGVSVNTTEREYMSSGGSLVLSTPLDPGSYFVMFSGTVRGYSGGSLGGQDSITCYINAGDTTIGTQHVYVSISTVSFNGEATMTVQGMFTSADRLTVGVYCSSSSDNGSVGEYAVMSAVQLQSASGNNAH